jgi:hypothetical protein
VQGIGAARVAACRAEIEPAISLCTDGDLATFECAPLLANCETRCRSAGGRSDRVAVPCAWLALRALRDRSLRRLDARAATDAVPAVSASVGHALLLDASSGSAATDPAVTLMCLRLGAVELALPNNGCG